MGHDALRPTSPSDKTNLGTDQGKEPQRTRRRGTLFSTLFPSLTKDKTKTTAPQVLKSQKREADEGLTNRKAVVQNFFGRLNLSQLFFKKLDVKTSQVQTKSEPSKAEVIFENRKALAERLIGKTYGLIQPMPDISRGVDSLKGWDEQSAKFHDIEERFNNIKDNPKKADELKSVCSELQALLGERRSAEKATSDKSKGAKKFGNQIDKGFQELDKLLNLDDVELAKQNPKRIGQTLMKVEENIADGIRNRDLFIKKEKESDYLK